MELDKIDLEELLPQMEIQRKAMRLSYQNLADYCDISQRSMIRMFKRETPPSLELLQKLVTVLGMEQVQVPIAPAVSSTEEYIRYLKECIHFERKDKQAQLNKQEAQHNRQRSENRRVLIVVTGILGMLMAFVCGVLVYDIAHPDRGWIQEYMTTHGILNRAVMAVRSWLWSLWA